MTTMTFDSYDAALDYCASIHGTDVSVAYGSWAQRYDAWIEDGLEDGTWDVVVTKVRKQSKEELRRHVQAEIARMEHCGVD